MLEFIIKYKPFFDFLVIALPIVILPRKFIFTQQDAYEKLVNELSPTAKEYIEKMAHFMDNPNPTYRELSLINNLGGLYFEKITMVCDRVLEGIVNQKTIKNSFFPRIKKIVESKLIETHYDTLNIQAEKLTKQKNTFVYDIEMYKSIFEVYYKFIKDGSSLTDYKLKPLRYIWQKAQCLIIPALAFGLFQVLVASPT